MLRQVACLCLMLSLCPAPSHAAARTFTLDPTSVKLTFRAYGLGLIPIEGSFTRLAGTLALDDADPTICTLSLHADSASLQMPQSTMTAEALGPGLLDAAHFPDFRIEGRCQGPTLVATLLLHGITGPVTLAVTPAKTQWTAAGPIRRAAWGMGARPFFAGPEVRITLTAGLPPNLATSPK